MTDTKSREFWITDPLDLPHEIYTSPTYNIKTIHVIEYSAYKGVKQTLDGCMKVDRAKILVIVKLQAKLKIARTALEHYQDRTTLSIPEDWNSFKMGGPPNTDQLETEDIGETARSAITKIRGEG